MYFIQSKNFCASKDTIKKVKDELVELLWEIVFEVPQNVTHIITTGPSNITPRFLPKRTDNRTHSDNNQKTEATNKMSTNR